MEPALIAAMVAGAISLTSSIYGLGSKIVRGKKEAKKEEDQDRRKIIVKIDGKEEELNISSEELAQLKRQAH